MYMKSSVYYRRVLQNDRRMNSFKTLLVCGLFRSWLLCCSCLVQN